MRMNMKVLFLLLSLTLAMPMAAQEEGKERTPAFPGAEGYGRYVTGGRGGQVYRVTNLNDSGEGSLRNALTKGGSKAKTIVFGVSGTIHLQSSLSIPSNTTIAGQTAPGDGICLADYPCSIKGNNVIVRYMRFRLGNKNVTKDGADGWDAFGGMDCQDWMIDHCSVSWSIDECLSVLGNKNTTVQWCLVSQSLVNAGHSKGAHGYGGNWGGTGASFHHNLLAHHTSRTPRLGPRPTTQLDERMDYRNNVIYNFGGNGCYGGEGMKVNIVNNYYKPGPGSPTNYKGKRIAAIGVRTNEYVTNSPAYAPALHLWGKFFAEGNVNSKFSDVAADNWANGIYNQTSNGSDNDYTYTAVTRDTMKITEPIPFVMTTTHSAILAYDRVLNYAGASKSRDSYDEMIVSDTRKGTASYTGSGLSKGFINSQEDNKPAGAGEDWSAWPELRQEGSYLDNDGDGMDDTWEESNGLDNTNPADGNLVCADGYTNLEHYLNSLVSAITTAQNEGGVETGEKQYIEIGGNGDENGKEGVANGTISWTVAEGLTETAECAASVAQMVVTTNISAGANVYYNKSRNLSGIRFSEILSRVDGDATANTDNGIAFNITMAEGYYFRPTHVKFLASRLGTDGGMVNVAWQNENGNYVLDNGTRPARNNETIPYSTFDIDINDIGSATGTNTLFIHIYKLGSGKAIALSSVAIDGEVKVLTNGIESIATGPMRVLYHTTDGVKLSAPRKGLNIETTILPDGTRKSRKMIIR